MKKISYFIKLRGRLKAARELGRIEGELKASGEFQKSLRKLSQQTRVAMIELEGAHELNIKLLTVKEKEFQDVCDDLKKEREKVRQALRNIDKYESKGLKQVQNIETILNDERTNKLMNVDLFNGIMQNNFDLARKQAEKAGIIL